jgi:translocator protein
MQGKRVILARDNYYENLSSAFRIVTEIAMNSVSKISVSKISVSKITTFQILIVILVPIGIFGGNLFAVTDTATISNTLFARVILTPPGYVFAIWSLIYIGMVTLGVMQMLPAGRDNPRFVKARVPLIANMVFNFAWIAAWGSLNTPLSLLLIVGQLITAIWIFLSLEANRERPTRGVEGFIQVASGAYVTWLTLATVLNASCVLVYYKWEGFGIADATWAVAMMVIAALVGLLEIRVWRSVMFSAVFTWAFTGIAVRAGQPSSVVVVAAIIALIFLALLISNLRFFVLSPKRSPS